jgi:hypothetical protein
MAADCGSCWRANEHSASPVPRNVWQQLKFFSSQAIVSARWLVFRPLVRSQQRQSQFNVTFEVRKLEEVILKLIKIWSMQQTPSLLFRCLVLIFSQYKLVEGYSTAPQRWTKYLGSKITNDLEVVFYATHKKGLREKTVSSRTGKGYQNSTSVVSYWGNFFLESPDMNSWSTSPASCGIDASVPAGIKVRHLA